MSNPERTSLCAALKGNVAASLPQADKSVGLKGLGRVREVPCNS